MIHENMSRVKKYGQMFGIGFGYGIKDKQGRREAKFMFTLKIGSR